jgi:hypothetical protein
VVRVILSAIRSRLVWIGIVGVVVAEGVGIAGAVASPPEPASSGTITTIAGGTGSGPATSVDFQQPCGLASSGGQLYVGEGSSVVQRISERTGWLTTAAGTGVQALLGPPASGASATQANFSFPCTIAADSAGNLLISQDTGVYAAAARSGTFYGVHMRAGRIYVVAPGGPAAMTVDRFGDLIMADGEIRILSARSGTFYGQKMKAGGTYSISRRIDSPASLALDSVGNILIADEYGYRVLVLPERSGRFYGRRMTVGHLHVVAGSGKPGSSGDGGPAVDARFNRPVGVALDKAGNVIIADLMNNALRVVAERSGTFYGQRMRAGHIYAAAGTGADGVTGDGGSARRAELDQPNSVVTDRAGNLVIAGGSLDDLVPDDIIRVVAASTGYFYGRHMRAGNIYKVAGTGDHTFGFSGNGGLARRAQLGEWHGLARDASGNLILSDAQNDEVRMVAGRTGTFYGHKVTAGHIYAIAGTGTAGFSGDGGSASAARMHFPLGVVLDPHGNLVISDTFNNRVRVLAARSGRFYGQTMTTGGIYTIAGADTGGFSGDGGPAAAANLNSPGPLAFDHQGNLLIGDASGRLRVLAAGNGTFYRQAMKKGDIYTIAGGGKSFTDGGPATSQQIALNFSSGIVVDAVGNIAFTDGVSRVFVVAESNGTFYGQPMTAGDVYIVAGTARQGFSGDGGPATSAKLFCPAGITTDPAGNLLLTDQVNNRLRVVAASTGTFYGQPMTAGDIYTVAGSGSYGFSGDGGPADHAAFAAPEALIFDSAGDLLVADDIRVRQITY